MTRYTFDVLLNQTNGSRFFRFHDGDTFDFVGHITVEADSLAAAREKAWMVGNREERDAEGRRWPSFVRSLSVADLLVVPGSSYDALVAYEVEAVGFSEWIPVAFVPQEWGIRVEKVEARVKA